MLFMVTSELCNKAMGGKAAAVAFLVVLGGGLVLTQNAASPSPLPFTVPESCGEEEFYQSGDLSCVQCPPFSASSEDGTELVTLDSCCMCRNCANAKMSFTGAVV